MTSSRARIENLIEKGALAPEAGKDLLEAVNAQSSPRGASLLLNPLARFGGERLSLVGALAVLAGIGLGPWGVCFDGFLDAHLSPMPLPWFMLAIQAFAAWPLGAGVLWLASRFAGREGRYIDFLGLVGVARVPMVLFTLPLAGLSAVSPLPVPRPGEVPQLSAALLVTTGFALVGLVGFLTLLYRGFGTASGLSGARRVTAFVFALLVAELASKLLISLAGRALV